MIGNCIKSELKKINSVFIGMAIISIFLSATVFNLVYIYDNSYINIRNTLLTDYIYVNNILSGEIALFMPVLCIVMTAFIWTDDFETGCIKYVLIGESRRKWVTGKVIVSSILIFFLFSILGIGLTVFAVILGDKEIFSILYLKQLLLLLSAAFPMIVWVFLTGIISLKCKDFGKTAAGVLGIFLLSYIMENYFTNMKGILPTSAIIYIWGYNDTILFIKNIINVISYTSIFAFVLIINANKKEVQL